MNDVDRERSRDGCSGEWKSLAMIIRAYADEEPPTAEERAGIEMALAQARKAARAEANRKGVILAGDQRWGK